MNDALGRLRALRPRDWLLVLVGVLVLLALMIFDDYGITWDETVEHFRRRKGPRTFAFWFGGFDPANAMFAVGHNPFTFFAYYSVHRLLDALGIAPPIVDTYHFLTAMIAIVGVVFTYRVARHLMEPGWALACALGLILTPRYFGHAFANFKDIPFCVAWLICLDTVILAAKDPSWRRVLLHGLALGLLLTARIGGLMFLPITAVALLLGQRAVSGPDRTAWQTLAIRSSAAVGLALALSYLSYPYLLLNPVSGLLELLGAQSQFEWLGTTLTLGQELGSGELPRWYAPLWLLITLPEWVIGGLVLAGALAAVGARRLPSLESVVLILGAALPLGYVIAAQAPIYDGIRHILFVVPPLTIGAILGWRALHQRLRTRLAVPGVLGLAALILTVQIVRLHPYQAIWFNQLVGGVEGAEGRFTVEYWGSTSLESATWLHQNGKKPYGLCVIPEIGGSWEIYLGKTWNIEDKSALPACPLWTHYAVSFRRNAELEKVAAYVERHPERWEVVHHIERMGVRLGSIFRNKRPSSGP